MHKLLIIDDDASLAEMIGLHYEDLNYDVKICNTLHDATEQDMHKFDAILLDHHLTDGLGLNFLKALKEKGTHTPIIMMTGKHDMDLAIEALRLGALDYVHKPLDMNALDALIAGYISSQNISNEDDVITITPQENGNKQPKIVGTSPAILEVIKKLATASRTTSTTLIYGEMGTGKTLATKVLHHYFNKDVPYTHIHAGATFDAPTDAQYVVISRIEKLSENAQRDLLAWLVSPEQGHCKVVCTSNLTIEALKGRLITGLLNKLLDIVIHMPPLRERIEDMQPLVQAQTSWLTYTLNSPITGIQKQAIEVLSKHQWPGNIAELQDVLSYAIEHNKVQTLTSEHIVNATTKLHERKLSPSTDAPENAPTPQSHNLQSMEEIHVYNALIKHKGHKSNTAAELGISRPALDRKIAKYNIDIERLKTRP